MEYFGAPNNAIRAYLLGLVFQGVGMLLNLGALSCMAESSVTIVNSFSVLSIIGVSWWLLGERPGVQNFIGSIIVFLGMVLCVLSKPSVAPVLDFEISIEYLKRPQDTFWLLSLFCVSLILFFSGKNCDKHLLMPFGAGFMGGLSETLAKLLSGSFGHPTSVAIFASVISISVFIELNMIKTSLIYLKPHVHTLIFFVSWSLVGILSGGVMFDEFKGYIGKYDSIGILSFGVVSIVAGASIPSLLGPPRRKARVFRSGHKAVPEIIACLIRPPLVNVGGQEAPKYGIDSDDEEVIGDGRGRGIEMQSLTHVAACDRDLYHSTSESYGSDGPEKSPVGVFSNDSDE